MPNDCCSCGNGPWYPGAYMCRSCREDVDQQSAQEKSYCVKHDGEHLKKDCPR